MRDLSILIPARNEEFLQNTLNDIAENMEGDTEVLIGLDGYKPNLLSPGKVPVGILYEEKPIGQRAIQNRLAKISQGEFVMKVDAHCSFSKGFDIEMLQDMDKTTVLVPSLGNLHVWDWICDNCGKREYQGIEPELCCGEWKKEIVWRIKPKPLCSTFYFDTRLVFQFDIKKAYEDLEETMAIQGSGFMVRKKDYWDFEMCDEQFGSWGQQGVEVACKTWLGGGKILGTRKAFMGHWFRMTEGFPYERDMNQVEHAYQLSKSLFLENNWDKQIKSIQWLIEKFDYPGDWSPEMVAKLCKPFNK